MSGSLYTDELFGGDGNDLIAGGDRGDLLDGGRGDDILSGTGPLILRGGDGNDRLTLRSTTDLYGSSSVEGGSGDDLVELDLQDADGTSVDLGAGNDVVRLTALSGSVVIALGAGIDTIELADVIASYELPTATISDFAAGPGGDRLAWPAGFAGGGNSFLTHYVRLVQDGSDTLVQVWRSNDSAYGTVLILQNVDASSLTAHNLGFAPAYSGGSGNDSFTGTSGADWIEGDAGDDSLDGGAGADRMAGGAGNDLYFVDVQGDVTTEFGGEGTDEVRTGLATYTLGANVENLTGTAATGQILTGNGLNNVIVSGSAADRIRLESGGDDSAFAGAGTDSVFFGAALTTADSADGGADRDQLTIQGDYVTAPLVLGAGVVNFESFLLLSGTDTRFGDDGTHSYSYDIISHDANVAAGQVMVVDGAQLKVGENFTFDGSAETNGAYRLWGGMGIEDLTGGAMSDQFYFSSGRFGADDRVDGGAGASRDQLGLRGDYTLEFGAGQIASIESLLLLSGRGVVDNTDYDYDLTMDDLNLAGGVLMTVDAGQLTAGEHLTFDGSAETDGSFRIFGGAGADSLIGSANGDIIFGALGKDYLKGGAGADAYSYRSAADSTSTGYDTIDGFEFGVDTLDLPGVHESYGHVSGRLHSGSFDADLASAAGDLLAGHALFLDVIGGDQFGKLFLIVDQNGILGYQAGEDFVIEFANTVVPPPISDFIV